LPGDGASRRLPKVPAPPRHQDFIFERHIGLPLNF
jgi:hypothetical protein